MNLHEVPTLYPSEEEFREPVAFLSQPSIRRLGNRYGLLKVVPPPTFNPPLSLDKEAFRFQVRRQNLCELDLENRARLFFVKQLNNFARASGTKGHAMIVKEPSVPITDSSDAPATPTRARLFLYDVYIGVVKYYNSDIKCVPLLTEVRDSGRSPLLLPPLRKVEPATNRLWKRLSRALGAPPSAVRHVFKKYIATYYAYMHNQQVHSTAVPYEDSYPKSLLSDDEGAGSDSESDTDSDSIDGEECMLCKQFDQLDELVECASCGKFFHGDCINSEKGERPFVRDSKGNSWICRTCIMGNGYYGFKIGSKRYTLAEFIASTNTENPDSTLDIDSIEREFWNSVSEIKKRTVVKYGADIHNTSPGQVSGFPTRDYIPEACRDNLKEYVDYASHPANLMNLPWSKGSLLPLFSDSISGMTVPWVYVGSKFSTFCWHMEDQYTLSANYQHEGSPKVWYSIPDSSCTKFQNYLAETTPDLFVRQPGLMHQLTSLVQPDLLVRNGIECYRAVQQPNEYIVTFPKCYHAGFNSGYNLNEAVNFTTDFWLPYGMEAIDDYRVSGKQCVFDMFDLLVTILQRYASGETKGACDEALVREAYNFMLNRYNAVSRELDEVKSEFHLAQYTISRNDLRTAESKSKEQQALTPPESDDDEGDEEQIYCRCCKTICSFAFVVHPKQPLSSAERSSRKRITENCNWSEVITNLYEERPIDEHEVLCLRDYLTRAGNSQLKNFSRDDELYVIRDFTAIDDLLRAAGDRLDRI
ncbi:histone demethylase [Maudiozyma humilis]|uniref:Histone demethylase n=1 Tax=Maudiozyma humilis TaxID=51915 RepID=A0AAV5RVS5_MAUHU|nr:histone demethylase [Kazachstania humilis]